MNKQWPYPDTGRQSGSPGDKPRHIIALAGSGRSPELTQTRVARSCEVIYKRSYKNMCSVWGFPLKHTPLAWVPPWRMTLDRITYETNNVKQWYKRYVYITEMGTFSGSYQLIHHLLQTEQFGRQPLETLFIDVQGCINKNNHSLTEGHPPVGDMIVADKV